MEPTAPVVTAQSTPSRVKNSVTRSPKVSMIFREPFRLPRPSSPELITSSIPPSAGVSPSWAMNLAAVIRATTLAVSSPTPGHLMRPSSTFRGRGVVSGKTTSLWAMKTVSGPLSVGPTG